MAARDPRGAAEAMQAHLDRFAADRHIRPISGVSSINARAEPASCAVGGALQTRGLGGRREVMERFRIAVIAGDGVGQEVIPAGMRVLEAAAGRGGFALDWEELPWGSAHYLER